MRRDNGSWRVLALVAIAALILPLAVKASGQPASPDSDTGLGTGCSKDEVEARVLAFAAALREPNVPILREAWGPRMKWFSVTKTRGPNGNKKDWHFVAYRRRKAVRWVRARGGLPIELSTVKREGGGAEDARHTGFQYEGRWGDRYVVGKGDMLCDSTEIRVWSMAIRSQPLPGPSVPQAGHVAVAADLK